MRTGPCPPVGERLAALILHITRTLDKRQAAHGNSQLPDNGVGMRVCRFSPVFVNILDPASTQIYNRPHPLVP